MGTIVVHAEGLSYLELLKQEIDYALKQLELKDKSSVKPEVHMAYICEKAKQMAAYLQMDTEAKTKEDALLRWELIRETGILEKCPAEVYLYHAAWDLSSVSAEQMQTLVNIGSYRGSIPELGSIGCFVDRDPARLTIHVYDRKKPNFSFEKWINWVHRVADVKLISYRELQKYLQDFFFNWPYDGQEKLELTPEIIACLQTKQPAHKQYAWKLLQEAQELMAGNPQTLEALNTEKEMQDEILQELEVLLSSYKEEIFTQDIIIDQQKDEITKLKFQLAENDEFWNKEVKAEQQKVAFWEQAVTTLQKVCAPESVGNWNTLVAKVQDFLKADTLDWSEVSAEAGKLIAKNGFPVEDWMFFGFPTGHTKANWIEDRNMLVLSTKFEGFNGKVLKIEIDVAKHQIVVTG